MTGDFLRPQIIYQGKTTKCVPPVSFPSDWDITYTENHWSNEKNVEQYLLNVLFPFVEKKRQNLELDLDFPALVIFDYFRGQCTSNIFSMLEAKNILLAIVPARCTDRLQPLDISVNKAVKDCLRRQFLEWYSDQILRQLQQNESEQITSIDLRLSVVKHLSAKWLIGAFEYFKSNPTIFKNGFREVGLI